MSWMRSAAARSTQVTMSASNPGVSPKMVAAIAYLDTT
jgi:hypothetical protein